MGFDLSGAGGYIHFNMLGWENILKMAHAHGWRPLGTVLDLELVYDLPKGSTCADWDGGYFSNDYQEVTVEDALNIAAALKNALIHSGERYLEDTYKIKGEKIKEFIAFCEAGSFVLG